MCEVHCPWCKHGEQIFSLVFHHFEILMKWRCKLRSVWFYCDSSKMFV